MRPLTRAIVVLAAVFTIAAASVATKADTLSIQSGGFLLHDLGNDGSVANGLDSLVGSAESNTQSFNGSGVFTVMLNRLTFTEGFTGANSVGPHDFNFSQLLTINGQTQALDLVGRIDIGVLTDTVHILSSSPLTFHFGTFSVDVNILPTSIFGPGDGVYFDVLNAQLTVTKDCNPVPEPATLTLLGLGLAGTAAKLRRRRRQARALKR
jgi:hypothetical protein